jgi:hypothetical protein
MSTPVIGPKLRNERPTRYGNLRRERRQFLENFTQAGSHKLVCWSVADMPNLANGADDYIKLATIAVRYFHQNPSYRAMPAPALMLAAFMRQWPCGQVGPLRR